MAKLAVFFGLVLTVFHASAKPAGSPSSWPDKLTPEEVTLVTKEIQKEVDEHNLTCENYLETYCSNKGSAALKEYCAMWLEDYLCKKEKSSGSIIKTLKKIDAYFKKIIEDNQKENKKRTQGI